jgi:hypothetical protein
MRKLAAGFVLGIGLITVWLLSEVDWGLIGAGLIVATALAALSTAAELLQNTGNPKHLGSIPSGIDEREQLRNVMLQR